MNESDRSQPDLFSGARRARQYRELDVPTVITEADQDLAVPAVEPFHGAPVVDGGNAWLTPDDSAGAVVHDTAPTPKVRVTPAATVTPKAGVPCAQWGWRGRLGRATGGLVKLSPEPAELEHREALAVIGRATWTRAVNVIVTNPKGGSGKTPTALILAGILGHVRGGYVVVWEAAESAGSLTRRAEGDPHRGLAELLDGVGQVRSAGTLGGYTAPQTSHADVIGSVGNRAGLTAADVLAARRVLDTYYRVTVTDTGNNPGHEAYLTALHTADAVVLPCLLSADSLAGLEEVLAVMQTAGGQVAASGGLLSRVVVVLGHDGGPIDAELATAIRARLAELGLAAVVTVPYDPAIRRGGQLSLDALSDRSTRAWTAAAAAVVRAFEDAPTHINLVEQLADTVLSVTTPTR